MPLPTRWLLPAIQRPSLDRPVWSADVRLAALNNGYSRLAVAEGSTCASLATALGMSSGRTWSFLDGLVTRKLCVNAWLGGFGEKVDLRRSSIRWLYSASQLPLRPSRPRWWSSGLRSQRRPAAVRSRPRTSWKVFLSQRAAESVANSGRGAVAFSRHRISGSPTVT